MSKRITHWVDGKPWTGPAARSGEIFDPATGAVTGHVDFASKEDVDTAVAAASAAWRTWRSATLSRRAGILFDFRAALLRRRKEFAFPITSEHGKVLNDADGEIARGLEVVEFACGIPALQKGEFSESVSTQIDITSIRQPGGRVRRHHAVQLPRYGAAVVPPSRSPAATPWCSSRARRTRLRRSS